MLKFNREQESKIIEFDHEMAKACRSSLQNFPPNSAAWCREPRRRLLLFSQHSADTVIGRRRSEKSRAFLLRKTLSFLSLATGSVTRPALLSQYKKGIALLYRKSLGDFLVS